MGVVPEPVYHVRPDVIGGRPCVAGANISLVPYRGEIEAVVHRGG